MGESWTTWWKRAGLLGRREIDDGCTVGQERAGLLAGLLGGREVVDLVGAVLLGRREVDDGCAAEWESEGNTARRERVGRLGRRQVDNLVEEGCSAGREVRG